MSEPASDSTPASQPLELSQTDLPAYDALQNGAVYFELSPRHVSTFSGAGAAAALNGLITNDVMPLSVGRGMYAAALTPKGKLLADIAVLRIEPETFLVETSREAGAEWFAMVRKYINPRLAKYQDNSHLFTAIGVYGPRASAMLARLGGASGRGAMLTDALTDALNLWTDWTNASWKFSNTEARLVRAPYLGNTPGYVLLAHTDSVQSLQQSLAKLGAVAGSELVWNMAALESGRPVFGVDMDATTLPQEANLDNWSAISFEKGCYTGQETVARIHFRGHVNKHLRVVRSEIVLPIGATLHDENGKAVGDVRRSGLSPSHGAMAIAMLRREVAAGTIISATVAGSPVPVHITETVRRNVAS